MNSIKNNENIGKRISTGSMEMEESEKCALKFAEKRKCRKLAKRTDEIIEIEATLLTCLSNELVTNFDKCINKIIEAKFAEGSLVCYQIVINSIVALHSKQYPSYSEQAIQEMTNSLLQKIFQKMALDNYECAIDCDKNDLTKKRCHSELLCLLEMYLLRFTSSIASTSSKIHQDTKKSLGASTSASSSSAGIINFIMEPKKQLQKKNNPRPFLSHFDSITPTQLATKNIVARLRHLYLLCTDPEQFHQFIEDILCDEFIEELPFYLVSIYEQLGIEVPSELQPFKPQENNPQKNGRLFRLDLSDYKNKCADKLDQFLMKIEKFDEDGEEDKGNVSLIVKRKEKSLKPRRINNSMKKQLTLAPKKPHIPLRTMLIGRRFGNGTSRLALPGTSRFGGSVQKKIIEPPAGIAALKQKTKIGKQLAKRRIHPFIPETPEKKIGWKKNEAKDGEMREEDEVVEQTPLGKISTDNSSLAMKLAELLIREEMSQMSQLRQEILEENMNEFTSFVIDDQKENENRKAPSDNEVDGSNQCDENLTDGRISRKRPLTPSENSSSIAHLLQIKEQSAKRPRRRLFPSSRCSTISSTGTAFPFSGRQS